MASMQSGIGLSGSYPADPTQVATIRRAVNDVARRCVASDATLTRLQLAVTEAATNVVLHAYRTPAPAGHIHVTAGLVNGMFEVSIRDDGVGMSPHAGSPGLGLGLTLMLHEADSCEIQTPRGGGTDVRLGFAVVRAGRFRSSRSCGEQAGAGAKA